MTYKTLMKKQQQHHLCFSNQSPLSLMSYAGLLEKQDYLEIDGRYIRTMYIVGFPFVAHSNWLDGLINFNRDVDISFHISEIDSSSALPKLNRKITELESTKRAMIKSGKIIGSELTDPLDSAVTLRDKIQRGQEKLFLISVYVALSADSLNELNKSTKLIETAMSSRMFFVKEARYQQLDGLQSILPRAEDKLKQFRNMDSTTASLSFPFVSSELVQEKGILYGVNRSNNSLVMLDRFSLNNANSITFAQSGSGKSYATKVEIMRQLMIGTKVIVIDPEREYDRLTESVKGTNICLSINSNEHINPFDLNLSKSKKINMSEHIIDLTEIISLMVDGLNAREKAVIDKAIIQTYAQATHKQPILTDLYNQLLVNEELKLAERLEKYVQGSLAGLLNRSTNIKLDNRLVVFDIKDLSDNLRQIMMMIIANYVKTNVQKEPSKRLLVIDEAWILLEHEQSARFIASLVRRARKYWLGVAMISQQANDFLDHEYGRAIASQSSLRILMHQDTTTIKKVVNEFNLSEYEANYLLTCDKGEALIIADLSHVAVNVVASANEHPNITTDPNEIYR